MAIWAVIPVKDFGSAKTRLASVLTPSLRAGLAKAMYLDTLSAVCKAREVDRIAVVTNDASARETAAKFGAVCVNDPEEGLNAALDAGRAAARSQGGEAVLVLPADLPSLHPDDVAKIIAVYRETGGAVVVPDHEEDGTNALLVPSALELPYSYGQGSFRKHVNLIQIGGNVATVLKMERVACDCDLPADIERVLANTPGPFTRRFLNETASLGRYKLGLAI